jgi:hypothetical protein
LDCGPIFGEPEALFSADPSGVQEHCLPVPYGLVGEYEIEVDGQAYTGLVEPCDVHPVKFYDYAALPAGGNYAVVWQHDGTKFYTLVDNMSELAAAMHEVDPAGLWFNDADGKALVSMKLNGNYGWLSIRQHATGPVFTLWPGTMLSNTGTMLTLPDGQHTVTYTSLLTGCTEELLVNIAGGEESAFAKRKEGAGAKVAATAKAGIIVDGQFQLEGVDGSTGQVLRVFDVLGRLVFTLKDYEGGPLGDMDLPDGTYFYWLGNGKSGAFTGVIELRR